MAQYKCFKCGKKISSKSLEKKFFCPNCRSKIFYKPRSHVVRLKAI